MLPVRGFWAYWGLTAANVVVAAMIYLLLARLALGLVLRSDTIAMRVLVAVTKPVVAPIAVLVPRVVPGSVIVVFAIAWLYVIRLVLFVITPATAG